MTQTTTPAEAPERIEARAQLRRTLAQAAALEHHLACALLFAGWAVNSRAGERDRVEEAATASRAHRRQLADGADRHLAGIVQIANLTRALGGALVLERPRRRDLLASLTAALLAQAETRLGGAAPAQPADGPLTQVHAELTQLYTQVTQRIAADPDQVADAGPEQRRTGFADLTAEIVEVGDAAAASAALDLLIGLHQPDGAAAEPVPVDPAGPPPVRAVATAAALHPDGTETTLLLDARTRAVAELFSDAYGLTLTVLSQLLAAPEGWRDDDGAFEHAAGRLLRSVVRPLGDALTRLPVDVAAQPVLYAGPTFADGDEVLPPTDGDAPLALLRERAWELAVAATSARVASDVPAELREATAALQGLVVRFAAAGEGPGSAESRLADLRAIQASLDQGVQPEHDGPYLVTNAEDVQDWLGQPLPTTPQLALCRCGASGSKPYCDGSHARVDFTDTKSDQRLEDRQDVYKGQQVTVLDNRGTCAHSGFCTDRINTVFHLGEEPFVTPSGARMDEIVRAVRSCPSGALSYALSSAECRQEVDEQDRPPAIEVSKDGPYRITGGIPISEVDGSAVERNEGASDEHYSLCRCGNSQNKPFCSGMHWYVDFHDPVPDPDREPTIFEWAGGYPALLRMTRIFYEKHVPEDPLIGPLFAEMSPDHPQRVARWLSEVFGGPKNYSQMHGGYTRMLSQHVGKGISEQQRGRWVALMSLSADEAGIPRDAEFRSTFVSYIEWGSRLAVENSQQESRPPPKMPMPSWNWGTAGPPTGRVSSLPPAEGAAEEPSILPAEGEAVGFDQHVKTFFRSRDRQSMKFAFDLWAYDDVSQHAPEILERVRNGSMPCDSTWPPDRVAAFARWIDSGMAP